MRVAVFADEVTFRLGCRPGSRNLRPKAAARLAGTTAQVQPPIPRGPLCKNIDVVCNRSPVCRPSRASSREPGPISVSVPPDGPLYERVATWVPARATRGKGRGSLGRDDSRGSAATTLRIGTIKITVHR